MYTLIRCERTIYTSKNNRKLVITLFLSLLQCSIQNSDFSTIRMRPSVDRKYRQNHSIQDQSNCSRTITCFYGTGRDSFATSSEFEVSTYSERAFFRLGYNRQRSYLLLFFCSLRDSLWKSSRHAQRNETMTHRSSAGSAPKSAATVFSRPSRSIFLRDAGLARTIAPIPHPGRDRPYTASAVSRNS